MNKSTDYKKYVMRQIGIREAIEPQISPTARPPTILALGIRGSTTGGLPSGADQQGDISPTKVGGYDRVEPKNLNSKLIDKTPDNPEIHQSTPINDNPSTEAGVTHPHQIQVTAHEEPQSVTGASTDSDPTLTLKSAAPKGIEVDIPGENQEPEQEVHNEDDNTAMIPATSLSETFARHRKLALDVIRMHEAKGKKTEVKECATYGKHCDKHEINEESDICPHCNGSGEGKADGTICSTCQGSGSTTPRGKKRSDDDADDYEDRQKDKRLGLDEGKHKAGCGCGFCKNKGTFGKKKKEDVEEGSHDEDDDAHARDPDFKEKDEKQFRKDRSSSEVRKHFDKDKKKVDEIKDFSGRPDNDVPEWVRRHRERNRKIDSDRAKWEKAEANKKKDPKAEKVDEQQRLDESYAAPFQRMRSLAGVGHMILTSNGLFENKNDPGASKPFNTNWKMDKEKAGYVKINEDKLKKIKADLERKSKRGSLSDKEMELVKRMDEVLKRRSLAENKDVTSDKNKTYDPPLYGPSKYVGAKDKSRCKFCGKVLKSLGGTCGCNEK
jgi:hypothetical protein